MTHTVHVKVRDNTWHSGRQAAQVRTSMISFVTSWTTHSSRGLRNAKLPKLSPLCERTIESLKSILKHLRDRGLFLTDQHLCTVLTWKRKNHIKHISNVPVIVQYVKCNAKQWVTKLITAFDIPFFLNWFSFVGFLILFNEVKQMYG